MGTRDTIMTVLLFAGVAVQLLGVAGVVLLPSALDRVHYLAPSVLAAVLIGAAVVVQDSFSLIGSRAILIAAFFLFTGPALSHAAARALHGAPEPDE
jgi:multisubunit Na+/H+ antiporter MnhG subunit